MEEISEEIEILKKNKILKLKGILVQNSVKNLKTEPSYKILCKYGKKYDIRFDPIWTGRLKNLSWEHVVVSGVYNKNSNSLNLLYVLKGKHMKVQNHYTETFYEEDPDLILIQQEI